MTMKYVEHRFVWPETWNTKADEDGWPAHVEGVLRRDAIEAGVSLIGKPERVGEPERIIADTDGGPVKALRAFYRAAVAESVAITTNAVQAHEAAPGVWVADVPLGAPIVNVLHGLGTLGVDVDALDDRGRPCGYRGFVPVSPEEVEVIPSPVTRRVEVRLDQDEIKARAEAADPVSRIEGGGGARLDAAYPRRDV